MSLIGCFGFYVAYREWMAWLFLNALIFLPILSLLISLPSMLLLQAELIAPTAGSIGTNIELKMRLNSRFPLPPVTWQYRLRYENSAKWTRVKPWQTVSPEHCGCLQIELVKAWKYDYLGLFRWKLCKNRLQTVVVFPNEVPVEQIPGLKKLLVPRWKVKGIGFSENYDLRPYRPGDSLKQIHWKLSAKTGGLIFREAIVPVRPVPVLTLILRGNESEIDEKLGKFMYLSNYLSEHNLPHELYCLSGEGMKSYRIGAKQEMYDVLNCILRLPQTDRKGVANVKAIWTYHIGGEADEA